MRRKAKVALIGALVLLGVGTSGAAGLWWWLRVDALDYDTDEAVALFTRVLHGEHDLRDRAISALAGAIDHDPDDARAQLWFGLANLEAYLARRELPYAIRASRAFDHAVALDPSDTSAAGWRAFFAYQAAKSRDEDLDGPRRALFAAADADPRFTPFLVAVSVAELPLDTGYPRRALARLEGIEDCGDGTSWSCRRGPLFPFGAEGFHATLGDLRVRVGDLEGGQAEYAEALSQSNAADWPYRDAFARWAEAAPERARLLTNDDLSDDPEVFFASGERACAACHQSGH